MASQTVRRFRGGCHCGAVQFEVDLPVPLEAHRCNCSICRASGFLHLFAARPDFCLLRGEDCLSEYRFHTKTARHLFCSRCGVKSFYVPRSHPEGYSINLNCLDLPGGIEVRLSEFDGRNWSAAIGGLRGPGSVEGSS